MTDGEIATAVAGVLTAAGGSVLGLGRWLGGVWRDIRREEIAAAKESAAAQRAQTDRMVDAMVESSRASATLSGKVDALGDRIAHLFELYAEPTSTKTTGRFRRERTNPQGFRPSRPGDHHDD